MENVHPIDVLVKVQVAREDIQMLAKFVEGLGHLGVVTTIDKREGIVLIQTTESCWPELHLHLQHLPLAIRYLDE